MYEQSDLKWWCILDNFHCFLRLSFGYIVLKELGTFTMTDFLCLLHPGSFSLRNIPETLGGLKTRIAAWSTVLMLSLLACVRSVLSIISKRLSSQAITCDHYSADFPPQGYTGNGTLTSVLTRLGELEEKVKTLEAKPPQVPLEKEELLHAAVYRVDALEAELISMKKVLLFH